MPAHRSIMHRWQSLLVATAAIIVTSRNNCVGAAAITSTAAEGDSDVHVDDDANAEDPLRYEPQDQKMDGSDSLLDGWPNFVHWFRSHGGTVDGRLTVGYDPRTATHSRGMIATSDIPAGTFLTEIPQSLFVKFTGVDQCAHFQVIMDDLNKGTNSKWHTYFEFDGSTGSGTRTPYQWNRVNGMSVATRELQGLPPAGFTHKFLDTFKAKCLRDDGKKMTDVHWKALLMLLTRGTSQGLAPMYHLFNHHNGLINTKLGKGPNGELAVIASTDIPANAPIYISYTGPGGERDTIDVFNQYGFVEGYPQLWRWDYDTLRRLESNGREDNVQSYEINKHPAKHFVALVISPTMVALSPSKEMLNVLGNGQLSLNEWQHFVDGHHASLPSISVSVISKSAKLLLNKLPTTIEEDEVIIAHERRTMEGDANKGDVLQAIEFRLAYKRALRLIVDAAENDKFLVKTKVP